MKKWYAITSREYTEWDRGSEDLKEAIEMMQDALIDEHEVKIALINPESQYCEDECSVEDLVYTVIADNNFTNFEDFNNAMDAAYIYGTISGNVKVRCDVLCDGWATWSIDTEDAERYVLEKYAGLARREAEKVVENHGVVFYPDNNEGFKAVQEANPDDAGEIWDSFEKIDTGVAALRMERFA